MEVYTGTRGPAVQVPFGVWSPVEGLKVTSLFTNMYAVLKVLVLAKVVFMFLGNTNTPTLPEALVDTG